MLDGRGIEINHIGYAENRNPFAIKNMNYSLLTTGMVYDLMSRKVIYPGPIAPPKTLVPKTKKDSKK